MKLLRFVCLGFVALGALILFVRKDSEDSGFGQLPFPGVDLTIKMVGTVGAEGDYQLEASIPKVGEDLGLGPETIPCALTISITRDDKLVVKEDVGYLERYGEFGFAHIQFYKNNATWHLTPGEYDVEVKSHGNCPAAASRGAILSLEQQTTQPTEHFLASSLRYGAGIVFLCGGWLGLVFCEIKDVIRRAVLNF